MTVIMGDYRMQGDKVVMSVPCERCGTIIGELEPGEVLALVSGRYGKVLCFECEENSCSHCQKEMTERDMSDGNYGVCWFCYTEGKMPNVRFDPDWQIDLSVTILAHGDGDRSTPYRIAHLG